MDYQAKMDVIGDLKTERLKSGLTYSEIETVTLVPWTTFKKWWTRKSKPSPKTEAMMAESLKRLKEFNQMDADEKRRRFPHLTSRFNNEGRFLHKAEIFMPTGSWVKLEELRGDVPRGIFIAGLLDKVPA